MSNKTIWNLVTSQLWNQKYAHPTPSHLSLFPTCPTIKMEGFCRRFLINQLTQKSREAHLSSSTVVLFLQTTILLPILYLSLTKIMTV